MREESEVREGERERERSVLTPLIYFFIPETHTASLRCLLKAEYEHIIPTDQIIRPKQILTRIHTGSCCLVRLRSYSQILQILLSHYHV